MPRGGEPIAGGAQGRRRLRRCSSAQLQLVLPQPFCSALLVPQRMYRCTAVLLCRSLEFCVMTAKRLLKVSRVTVLGCLPWGLPRSLSSSSRSCTPAYGSALVRGGSSHGAATNSPATASSLSGRPGLACGAAGTGEAGGGRQRVSLLVTPASRHAGCEQELSGLSHSMNPAARPNSTYKQLPPHPHSPPPSQTAPGWGAAWGWCQPAAPLRRGGSRYLCHCVGLKHSPAAALAVAAGSCTDAAGSRPDRPGWLPRRLPAHTHPSSAAVRPRQPLCGPRMAAPQVSAPQRVPPRLPCRLGWESSMRRTA